MAPRVVLNALALAEGSGGVSAYIRDLLAALPGAWPDGDRPDLVAAVQRSEVGEVPSGIEPLPQPSSAGWRRALASARGFGPADLFHGLDADLPLRPTCPTVCTVHDMAVFDAPWAFPRSKAVAERRIVASSIRRADEVIAVSAFTAERVAALTGVSPTVVLEAPAARFRPAKDHEVEAVRAKYRLPATFVLHVGNVEPRKDLATVVAACRAADLALVLTGQALWGTALDAPGVVRLGVVPAAELPALYAAATIVVCASRYEGFGLPPVEAATCGATLVSTPVPSVDEVLGRGAGAEVFAAGDVDGLIGLLRALTADAPRRQALAAEALRRVAGLGWAQAAAQTAAVYRRAGL